MEARWDVHCPARCSAVRMAAKESIAGHPAYDAPWLSVSVHGCGRGRSAAPAAGEAGKMHSRVRDVAFQSRGSGRGAQGEATRAGGCLRGAGV